MAPRGGEDTQSNPLIVEEIPAFLPTPRNPKTVSNIDLTGTSDDEEGASATSHEPPTRAATPVPQMKPGRTFHKWPSRSGSRGPNSGTSSVAHHASFPDDWGFSPTRHISDLSSPSPVRSIRKDAAEAEPGPEQIQKQQKATESVLARELRASPIVGTEEDVDQLDNSLAKARRTGSTKLGATASASPTHPQPHSKLSASPVKRGSSRQASSIAESLHRDTKRRSKSKPRDDGPEQPSGSRQESKLAPTTAAISPPSSRGNEAQPVPTAKKSAPSARYQMIGPLHRMRRPSKEMLPTQARNSEPTEADDVRGLSKAHPSSPVTESRSSKEVPATQAESLTSANVNEVQGALVAQSGSPETVGAARQIVSSDGQQQDEMLSDRAPTFDADDFDTTNLELKKCLKKHVSEVREDHAYLVQGVLYRQRASFEREHEMRKRLDDIHTPPQGFGKFIQKESPFRKMSPIQKDVKRIADGITFSQQVFINPRAKGYKKSKTATTVTPYKSTAVDVPIYREYIRLKDNVVSENETNMLNWPYFDDSDCDDEHPKYQNMRRKLLKNYRMKNIARDQTKNWHDLRTEAHRFYSSCVEDFLQEIGIGWQNVLYWYLASEEDLKRINSNFESNNSSNVSFERHLLPSGSKREKRNGDDDLDRSKSTWTELLTRLSEPSPAKLRLAALASRVFEEQTGFNLWHLARRSSFMQEDIAQRLEKATTSDFEYRKAACRICQLHNCPFHGELRENPHFEKGQTETDTDSASEDASDSIIHSDDSDDSSSDSDIDQVTNYRRAVNATTTPAYAGPDIVVEQPKKGYTAAWWKSRDSANWEKRSPFYPCSHEGSCDQAQCRCYREDIPCEKTCRCATSCIRRFRGCDCAHGPNRKRALCGTKECACYILTRECDADLCGKCGATEVLNPVYRYDDSILHGRCCNVSIQRGVPKKTILGDSVVHGFGLYAGEDVKKNDFIAEYTGEIVTKHESARRTIIYNVQSTMYLFMLNKKQDVDATNFGNKTRFINSAEGGSANCAPKNVLCNTVRRIGIFATEDIKAGTELFFDYGPKFSDKSKDFIDPKGSKPPPKPKGIRKASAAKAKGKQPTKTPTLSSSSSKLNTQSSANLYTGSHKRTSLNTKYANAESQETRRSEDEADTEKEKNDEDHEENEQSVSVKTSGRNRRARPVGAVREKMTAVGRGRRGRRSRVNVLRKSKRRLGEVNDD